MRFFDTAQGNIQEKTARTSKHFGAASFVRDIMTRNPVTVEPTIFLYDALQMMKEFMIRRLPVVSRGHLVGIITDRDILEAAPFSLRHLSMWELLRNLSLTTVQVIMKRPVITISPEALVEQAVTLLFHHRIGALPVVEQGHAVGIVTRTDILRFLSSRLDFGKRICQAVVRDTAEARAKLGELFVRMPHRIQNIFSSPDHSEILVTFRIPDGKADVEEIQKEIRSQQLQVLDFHWFEIPQESSSRKEQASNA